MIKWKEIIFIDLKIIKEYNDAITLYESKNELMFYNEEGERIYLNVYNLAKFCCKNGSKWIFGTTGSNGNA